MFTQPAGTEAIPTLETISGDIRNLDIQIAAATREVDGTRLKISQLKGEIDAAVSRHFGGSRSNEETRNAYAADLAPTQEREKSKGTLSQQEYERNALVAERDHLLRMFSVWSTGKFNEPLPIA